MMQLEKKHYYHLQRLLQRYRENSIRLNEDKTDICRIKINFFGHIVTKAGIKPDPAILDAILILESLVNRRYSDRMEL